MPESPAAGQQLDELAQIVAAVRDRVSQRYPGTSAGSAALADLLPLIHARDAALAKVASIGSVNPRAGGAVNALIQKTKRLIARSLNWFVRDQVTFNRETVACVEAALEAFNQINHALATIGQDARQFNDIRTHWLQWRAEWDQKLIRHESLLLRAAADLQNSFHQRVNQLEAVQREHITLQHRDFTASLDSAAQDIQKRLWADLENIRLEYERLIHRELRVLRQRIPASPQPEAAPSSAPATPAPAFDYQKFADRFRGPEAYVRNQARFYVPFFTGKSRVLEIGCGRGELLDLFREHQISASGIDLLPESVAYCRSRGLDVQQADLFPYLDGLDDRSLDAILASQVVEHLDPVRLPEMLRLCAAKLSQGGILAIETPDPECLAIFASHFYLDPTHFRPVPAPQLAFYLEEFGMGGIEIHKLSPARETFPEIDELPRAFAERFFGGLDYALIARKL